MLFTLTTLAIFLFFGGWQTPLEPEGQNLASLAGGLIFFVKTILIFSACLAIKYHLPILTNWQIIKINLRIQIPVLTLIWLGLLIIRWL